MILLPGDSAVVDAYVETVSHGKPTHVFCALPVVVSLHHNKLAPFYDYRTAIATRKLPIFLYNIIHA